MDRCHLYLPLVDSSGATYQYAEITLLDPDTGNPIDEPVYLGPIGGAPQAWPVLVDPAIIDLWTDNPLRVTVQALLPGGATFTETGVDITPAPTATIRSQHPLHIASSDGISSEAILGVSPDGSATWQVLNALKFHQHEGDAPDSTVIGSTTLTDIYPGETWVGNGITGTQGTNATALGALGTVNGDNAIALGRATASTEGLAAGAGAVAADYAVALGASSTTAQAEQVALGSSASAAASPEGAVVVGSGTVGVSTNTVQLPSGVQILASGNIVLGHGTLPDLSWLPIQQYVAILGEAVTGRFFGARGDVSLAGTGSPLGFYGAAGGYQALVNTSGVTTSTPGRAALLSLLSALDTLGLVYQTDISGVIDDELADFLKSYAHNSNVVLDTGDSSGFFAGDLNRAKRNATGTGTLTYRLTAGIRDFRLHAFTSQPSGADPAALAASLVADVSYDATTWLPAPLAWQPLTNTTGSWYQTWAGNAHAIPPGVKYLRLTLQTDPLISSPQIGRVIVRPRTGAPSNGFGSGGFGSGSFGG